jgi:maleate cis-trans isomerase
VKTKLGVVVAPMRLTKVPRERMRERERERERERKGVSPCFCADVSVFGCMSQSVVKASEKFKAEKSKQRKAKKA